MWRHTRSILEVAAQSLLLLSVTAVAPLFLIGSAAVAAFPQGTP